MREVDCRQQPSDAMIADGNPLKDLALQADQGKHPAPIMTAGILHKNGLT
jgi:hypothetical protein